MRSETPAGSAEHGGRLSRYFRFTEHGTTWGREITGGITTFMAMAYIAVVNPAILADAGMDFNAVFVATCLAAAIGSMLMGLLANYPVALAPGMGQNAFFTYVIVIGEGHAWRTALGAVFLSGMLFLALSLTPAREYLINAIPRNLKIGIGAGIGLLLAMIALQNSGVVVADAATLVSFGTLAAPAPLLCLGGFALIVALQLRKIRGALLIGMFAVAGISWLFGISLFTGVVSPPPSMLPVMLQLDIGAALQWSMVTVILSLLLIDVFDTAGTLVAVAGRAGMLDSRGHLPRLRPALLADSTATTVGALLGTSSTTSYVESAAGVEAGGRTGVTAITVGLLFLGCLWFSPLAASIPAHAAGAALLVVACTMVLGLRQLDAADPAESVPAVVCAVSIPFSYSIADGIGLGFLFYAGIALLSGRERQCPAAVWIIALIFGIRFWLL